MPMRLLRTTTSVTTIAADAGKMRILLFILLLFLLTSCQVFKQKDKSSSRSERENYSQIDINHEKDLEKIRSLDETITIRRDGDYFTEIKPRGPFTLSPDGSFSGEAESVIIHGKSTEQREESRTVAESERDQGKLQESREQSETTLDVQKNVSKTTERKASIKGWIGAGIATLVVVIGLALAWKHKTI